MLIFIWFDWFVLVCLVVGFLGVWQCFLYCLVCYLVWLVFLFICLAWCVCFVWCYFVWCSLVWLICLVVCIVVFESDLSFVLFGVFWFVWCFGLVWWFWFALVLFVWFGGLSGVWFGCFWKCYDFLGDLFGAFLCGFYFSWLLKCVLCFGLIWFVCWFGLVLKEGTIIFTRLEAVTHRNMSTNLTLSLLSRED